MVVGEELIIIVDLQIITDGTVSPLEAYKKLLKF